MICIESALSSLSYCNSNRAVGNDTTNSLDILNNEPQPNGYRKKKKQEMK